MAHTLLTVQGQLSPFGQIISGELLRTVGIGGTLIGSAFSASVQCAAFQCVVCSVATVAFSCQCTTCSTLGVRASVRCRPSSCQHQPPTSNRETNQPTNQDPASTTTNKLYRLNIDTVCKKCDQWEPKYLFLLIGGF